MKKHLTLCATLLVFGVGGIATANAQYYYGAPRPPAYVGPRMYAGLPPHEILAIVRAAGLVPLSPAVRRGPRAYVLTAAGPRGEPVTVVVDAYAGDVRRVSPRVAAYPYDPRTHGALVEREIAPARRDLRERPPSSYPRSNSSETLTPPRNVPNPRTANAPATNPQVPAAKPEHAPLPRPRPGVAATTPTPEATVPPPAAAPVQPQQAVPTPAAKPETAPPKPEAPALAPVTPLD